MDEKEQRSEQNTEKENQQKTGKPSNNQTERRKLSPSSWVTVRIWKTVGFDEKGKAEPANLKDMPHYNGRGFQFGHVSLKTNQNYASFWPTVDYSTNLKTPVSAGHALGANHDRENERRRADVETTLYSLDETKIDEEFEKFETERNTEHSFKKSSGWSAKGSGWYNQYRGENCSGLSYRLLKAGGINELSPVCKKLDSKILTVTPNEMAECVQDAKQRELALYPETKDFSRVKTRTF